MPLFLLSQILWLGVAASWAQESHVSPADGGPKEKYILVGVAGFKTSKSDDHDIVSRNLAQGAEPNGAWSNLPVDQSKVAESYFLTHFQDEKDLDRVLARFDGTSGCDPNLGLVIMANSWGSNGANALAFKYFEKCHRLADYFVMVDGVQKPIGAYHQAIWASRCVNYFQSKDIVHGGKLRNCENVDLSPTSSKNAPAFSNHIRVEWEGTRSGADQIRRFLFNPCVKAPNDDFSDLYRTKRTMESIVDSLYRHEIIAP
jgi:hypothetical protein